MEQELPKIIYVPEQKITKEEAENNYKLAKMEMEKKFTYIKACLIGTFILFLLLYIFFGISVGVFYYYWFCFHLNSCSK